MKTESISSSILLMFRWHCGEITFLADILISKNIPTFHQISQNVAIKLLTYTCDFILLLFFSISLALYGFVGIKRWRHWWTSSSRTCTLKTEGEGSNKYLCYHLKMEFCFDEWRIKGNFLVEVLCIMCPYEQIILLDLFFWLKSRRLVFGI